MLDKVLRSVEIIALAIMMPYLATLVGIGLWAACAVYLGW
jgi:hypothetical protein